jgi:hypothetical protein
MKDYKLVLWHSAKGPSTTIPFQALDAAGALPIVHQHSRDGWAELWENGTELCRLEYSRRGFWMVTPAALRQ